MKNKHMIANAQALIRQKHPPVMKMLNDAKGGKLGKWTAETVVTILADPKKPKGESASVLCGDDFIRRGTSFDHVLAAVTEMEAASTKEVKQDA